MNSNYREIGRSKSFEAFSDKSAKPLEEFADRVANIFFARLDKFKKADKVERVGIINNYLSEGGVSPEEVGQVDAFLKLIDHLDGVDRSGWNKEPEPTDIAGIKAREVANAEDVAMHSYGLINLCLLVAEGRSDINLAHAVKMAAIHDLAERKTGDIITAGKTDELELAQRKAELEEAALKEICSGLEDANLAAEVYEIWRESEEKQTPEAKLVKELDKLEAVIQAYNYSLVKGNKVDPQEFINTARKKISDPQIVAILEYVQRLATGSTGT